MTINKVEDVVLCSKTIQEEGISPIFLVSNKTGKGLDLFTAFLNILPINTHKDQFIEHENETCEFHITETFPKNGEQILSGMVNKGHIAVRQQVLLGPDNEGKFRKVEIKDIHCKKVPVR